MTQIKVLILLLVSTLSQANPDAIIKNLTYHQYDDQGKLVQTLKSKHIQHQPNENQYHLQQPFVQISRPENKTPITITAKTAQALQDGTEIHLHNQVKIQQDGQLTTENITLYPKAQRAETQDKLQIKQPSGDNLTATGMIALLAEQRVQFLKDIKALFTPKDASPIHAAAHKLNYDGKTAQVALIGQAKVAQNGNIFQAPKINYDLKQQKVETPSVRHKQTEIVLEDFEQVKQ